MSVDFEMLVEPPVSGHVWGKRWPGPHQSLPAQGTIGMRVADEVDPRAQMPPIFDQGNLGSCTANATAAVMQYDAILDGKDCGELSRLWIYFYERALEGTLGQGDTGAVGHDAFRVARHGIPDESLWPYVIGRFEDRPPNMARAYRLSKPVKAVPQTEHACKQVLSAGQTIAFGFTVYESFESQEVANTGIVPVPDTSSEQVLGGHEPVAVGFLRSQPSYVLCRNSWGVGWGLVGYFLFPWKCFLNRSMTSDLRTIVRV